MKVFIARKSKPASQIRTKVFCPSNSR
uniref:Uncharacterized protein n=1 Tax=Anguilla anguilla TaxID=7936 RepID=A0A0E9W6N6_ANGAN